MTFFYDMNKKLKEVLDTPKSEHKQLNERDEGKHNNATTGFKALAAKAAKEYGSKAAGERVAGAVHAKMKKAGKLEEQDMEEGMFDSLKQGMKKVAKKGLEKLGHGSDEAMRRDLQKKMGVPQTGKKPMGEEYGPMESEGGVPMTPKQKKFAKLAPPADKITFADKIAGAKKEVDEVLGDVAANAMRKAVSGHGTNKKKSADEGSDWSQLGKEYSRPKIGSVERGHKHDIEHTATGRKVTRRTDDQGISVGADDDAGTEPVKRGRGRPKGSGKAMGAKGPSGTSKLMSREGEMDEVAPPGAKAERMVKHIKKSLSKDGKLSDKDKAIAYATTWKAHKKGQVEEESTETRDERAEKAGRKVAKDIEYDEKVKDKIHGKKRGSEDDKAEKAGKRVTKDIEYDEKKSKKKEKTEESDAAPTSGKGVQFGKGIYDSLNREIENLIAESMSINASDSTEGGKSLTITATDEDAIKLAGIVRNAGLGGEGEMDSHEHGDEPCEVCGSDDCGCGDIEEAVSENEPNWPTDEETSDDALQYSGGLNGPKSTGQTTVPVIAHQGERTGVDDEALRRMMEMAGLQSELKPWERTMKEEAEEELDEQEQVMAVEEDAEELDEAKEMCDVCEATPCKCDESIEESLARFRSLAGLKEAAKPDYIDLDKDGDKEESMKKAADDKEKAEADKKVEESIFKMSNLWKSYKG
jgi:hypothetical protein